ncbi:MAG: hypothetical protein EPN84_01430 [Legionella sp.]|nr:MAG: hypothetical protein EPN84_01430 [Legionella sp.]
MAAFTIFAFGTGESSKVTYNVISQFAETCETDHLVINGPDLLGRRVVRNATNATEGIIQWLEAQTSIENNLNLVGFSRGAVTHMRVANYLQMKESELSKKETPLTDQEKLLLEKIKHLKIHILAIDPVAGIGDKGKYYSRNIPKNVKSFVAFYQMDERRVDFKPQDITRLIIESPADTQVSLLPLYGNHAEAIRIRTSRKRTAPMLVWHSLYHFLVQHGTTFEGDQIPHILNIENGDTMLEETKALTAKDWLELYSQHKEERPAYLGSGNVLSLFDGIPAARRIRSLNFQRAFYVKNHGFFTNQFERGLLKITYPKVFNYLFERNMRDERFPEDSQCSQEQVIAQLKELEKNNPLLFKRLQVRGVKINEANIDIGEPRGCYDLESSASVKQIAPHLLPNTTHFAERSNQLNALHDLEKEIYYLTFRYEREKREILFIAERSKAEIAQAIRAKVLWIVNEEQGNREDKVNRILGVLEQHYFRLVRAHSSSELRYMLKHLLKKYKHEYQFSQTTLSQDVLTHVVDVLMTLVSAALNFVGNLGYLGAVVFYPLGYTIESLCNRIQEVLEEYQENPLITFFVGIFALIETLGYLIKNNFGLLPLFDLLSSSVKEQRDEWISAIRNIQIERQGVDPQEAEPSEDQVVYSDLESAASPS